MKIKVCGMKYHKNIAGVATFDPDYMGFIFTHHSKRFVGKNFEAAALECIPKNILKIGVFVDHPVASMHQTAVKYDLNGIQLHGSETPLHCEALKALGHTVIKAFQMDENFDFELLQQYEPVADYFLFDAPSNCFGGSGKVFNWQILSQYQGTTPFFLSGGLGLRNIRKLLELRHPQLYGLDFNSRLETKPGFKKEHSVQLIINKIKKYDRI